jgi:hypothetical protein
MVCIRHLEQLLVLANHSAMVHSLVTTLIMNTIVGQPGHNIYQEFQTIVILKEQMCVTNT